MSSTSECRHYWMPVAGYGREAVRRCVFCGEVSFPEALVDTLRPRLGFGLYSEQLELLERLRTRWEAGQDPGIPERVRRLL